MCSSACEDAPSSYTGGSRLRREDCSVRADMRNGEDNEEVVSLTPPLCLSSDAALRRIPRLLYCVDLHRRDRCGECGVSLSEDEYSGLEIRVPLPLRHSLVGGIAVETEEIDDIEAECAGSNTSGGEPPEESTV